MTHDPSPDDLAPLADDVADMLATERAAPPAPAAARARVLERLEHGPPPTPPPSAASPVAKLAVVCAVLGLGVAALILRGTDSGSDRNTEHTSDPAPQNVAPGPLSPSGDSGQGPVVPAAPTPKNIAPGPAAGPAAGAQNSLPGPFSAAPAGPRQRSAANQRVVPAPLPVETAPPVPERPKTLLADERALLDSARMSLRHEDSIAARVALRKHEREYAGGQLEEEREALWILVLDFERDDQGVEREAALFAAKHPASIFTRSIEAAKKRAQKRARER
ncbi:MAG: hypothetical protein IT381_32130 [Deltaproteobacteria bacterium]|nr:hypothetical protein [Deltaproteobacteria bacterium]